MACIFYIFYLKIIFRKFFSSHSYHLNNHKEYNPHIAQLALLVLY